MLLWGAALEIQRLPGADRLIVLIGTLDESASRLIENPHPLGFVLESPHFPPPDTELPEVLDSDIIRRNLDKYTL